MVSASPPLHGPGVCAHEAVATVTTLQANEHRVRFDAMRVPCLCVLQFEGTQDERFEALNGYDEHGGCALMMSLMMSRTLAGASS